MINPLTDHKVVVFYDVEHTSWKGFRESGWDMPGKFMEIVQIGAVRIDVADDWQELGVFSAYVKPIRNPTLSDYFTDLTGITQQSVDTEGHSFPDAMDLFMEFMNGEDAPVASHGVDHEVIALNCDYTGISVPSIFEGAINLRPWIANRMDVREGKYTSADLPQKLGLEHDGPAHDALGDARAVAATIMHLTKVDT
jgi:inhibitor of KinA sporulation pathway (predicted exonuclease)